VQELRQVAARRQGDREGYAGEPLHLYLCHALPFRLLTCCCLEASLLQVVCAHRAPSFADGRHETFQVGQCANCLAAEDRPDYRTPEARQPGTTGAAMPCAADLQVDAHAEPAAASGKLNSVDVLK